MQKRYCQCGMPIMVDYWFSSRGWKMLFWMSRAGLKAAVRRCPVCGESLRIDEMD